MKIERVRIDGEPVRRFFVIAEVTFADREAEPRNEYDHNYYEDSELRPVATDWMRDGLCDRDDSPAVRFRDLPEEPTTVTSEARAEGAPVTTTVDARKDLYAFAMQGKEHSPAVSERASEKIDAFRAAVVAEVVEALTAKAQERSAEAEEEMRRDLEEEAQVWHDAATVAAKLKRAKTEAQGG